MTSPKPVASEPWRPQPKSWDWNCRCGRDQASQGTQLPFPPGVFLVAGGDCPSYNKGPRKCHHGRGCGQRQRDPHATLLRRWLLEQG